MTENLSLNGAGGVTKRRIKTSREAFEEEMKRRDYPVIPDGNGGYCGITAYQWETWQAALKWESEVESE